MSEQTLTHVVGTFLIQAEGAFLNGAGLGAGADRNMTVPKTFSDFRDRVPYVSAQAWKRWLRETFQEENPDEPATVLRQLPGGTGTRGQTTKIGTEMDPVMYAEDDIFGYMRAERGQGRTAPEEEETDEDDVEAAPTPQRGERVAAVMRAAPFAASILISIRKSGWEGIDEGFVHLKAGTPLPYSTRFYNTQLQGVFGLHYAHLGVFRNEGDRIELDRSLVDKYLKEGKIRRVDSQRNVYEMVENPRKVRATEILKALAVLRGGAKQAAFATDVAPKAIVLAGLSCGNLIFNDLFEDTREGPTVKLATLQEIIADYADRLMTPVFIGIRTGYLHADSESALCAWVKAQEASMARGENVHKVVLTTPMQAMHQFVKVLP
jgi:CRISPR-associated protein Cst2